MLIRAAEDCASDCLVECGLSAVAAGACWMLNVWLGCRQSTRRWHATKQPLWNNGAATYTLTHCHCYTATHTHCHTKQPVWNSGAAAYTLSHYHCHTATHTHTHTHALPNTHKQTHTHTPLLTATRALPHTQPYTHTATHAATLLHTQSLSISLRGTHCLPHTY